MSSLASSYPLAEVTVPATGNTPVQLDSGGRSYRSGVSITNLSSTGTMYVRVQTDGATAPTSGNLTSATGWMYAIPPGGNLTQPWGTKVNLYAVGSASLACTVSEIDSEGEMMGFATQGNPDGAAALSGSLNTSDNRIMVQQRGTAVNLTADGTAYSGPCVLRRVVINTGTAGACIVYDNTAASGTIIGTIAGANPGVFEYDCTCSNGVYINLTAGQDVTVVVEPI